jgi:hypothetical protein
VFVGLAKNEVGRRRNESISFSVIPKTAVLHAAIAKIGSRPEDKLYGGIDVSISADQTCQKQHGVACLELMV